MRPKVQAPATGAQLAELLGIKGNLPLELDQVVSPVVVLADLPGPVQPTIHSTVAVAGGASGATCQVRPKIPCYLQRVWINTLSGGNTLFINLARNQAAILPPTSTGDGAIINSPNPGDVAFTSGLVPFGYNSNVAPAGASTLGILTTVANGLIELDYRQNPIALGPADWSRPNDLANGLAIWSLNSGTNFNFNVNIQLTLAQV